MIWGCIGIAVALIVEIGPAAPRPSIGRVVWVYRGGLLAAPLIGIAIGFTSRIFARASFRARIAIAVSTLYVAAFLFLLAAQGTAFVAGDVGHTSAADALLTSLNGAIFGLTWTGFVLALAPLAYVTHVLVSRQYAAA